MLSAAHEFVARLPWWALNITEEDVEIWRLQRQLKDLLRDLSAIQDETGVDFFDTEGDNYRNILGVVAKENEMCRGVDYLHFELRSLSLKLIQGHYLQKEVQRVAEDLKKLLALRKSSPHRDYEIRKNRPSSKKTE